MRRLFVPLGLCGTLAAVVYLYARRVEPFWLDVRKLTLRVPSLPPGLEGLRLAHLTDLHVTTSGPPRVLSRALEAIDEAQPDLVVLTGDLVDQGCEGAIAADALAPLASRPTFAILGNHDYNSGLGQADRLAELLLARGIRTLRDEIVPFTRDGSTLWIIGLDYDRRGRDGATSTIGVLPPEARPRLLLTHSAEDVERLPTSSADLALAGHTHGGQIYVPVVTRAFLDRQFGGYGSGRYCVNGIPTYINRGLGSLGIEARFLRRPEVTIITFRRGEGPSVLTPGAD